MITSEPGVGFFCVFEGLDGSGKSTLLERVAAVLAEDARIRARFTGIRRLKEPTDMPEGLAIRERLKESRDYDPAEWLEYFQSDRQRNVQTNIQPGVAAGELVLQDRYFFSTAAYQGSGATADDSGSPEDIVADSLRRGFPLPDLLIYLTIRPEDALERIDRDRGQRETFERLDRLQAVARRYDRVIPRGAVRLDAGRSPEALTADAVTAILESI